MHTSRTLDDFRYYLSRLEDGWPVILHPRVIIAAHVGDDGYRHGWTVFVDEVAILTGTTWAAGALMQGLDAAAKATRGELPRPVGAAPASAWGGR